MSFGDPATTWATAEFQNQLRSASSDIDEELKISGEVTFVNGSLRYDVLEGSQATVCVDIDGLLYLVGLAQKGDQWLIGRSVLLNLDGTEPSVAPGNLCSK